MDDTENSEVQPACPLPEAPGELIRMAHGGGGKWTQRLLEKVFLPLFADPALEERHDGAVVEAVGGRLAFTTDSYVVHPLFFPGGDIGDLAVYGTVNDLAMCGAAPLCLSAGFILEEGLPVETVRRVAVSMHRAAERSGVRLVTGDTKVVDRGKGDGIYLNTAGIGVVPEGIRVGPSEVQPGDAVLISGDLGRHGVAILSVREGIGFEGEIASDTAPLREPVEALLRKVPVHCLRDLTRGGLASALNEIATTRGLGVRISEEQIPVLEAVRGACEMLGLDPWYVANEGRFAAFVPAGEADRALEILHAHPVSAGAVAVGIVVEDHPGTVVLETALGAGRVLDMLSGEQLPRIC